MESNNHLKDKDKRREISEFTIKLQLMEKRFTTEEIAIWHRFLDLTSSDPESKCWIWNGATDAGGYGRFKADKVRIAHRYVYQAFNNVQLIPKQIVMHACDNSRCVHPMHLILGTQSQNATDRWKRTGRNIDVRTQVETTIRKIVPSVTKAQLQQVLIALGLETT